MDEEDNSETEVTYMNQTFLMSNMKTKTYKSASNKISEQKLFKGENSQSIFEGIYWFIQSLNNHL